MPNFQSRVNKGSSEQFQDTKAPYPHMQQLNSRLCASGGHVWQSFCGRYWFSVTCELAKEYSFFSFWNPSSKRSFSVKPLTSSLSKPGTKLQYSICAYMHRSLELGLFSYDLGMWLGTPPPLLFEFRFREGSKYQYSMVFISPNSISRFSLSFFQELFRFYYSLWETGAGAGVAFV